MKDTIYVNKLCSILYLTLKNIAKIRHKIDMDSTRILVQALVTSKLDYCNSLMLGSTEYNLTKLQRIQNSAACIVYKRRYVLHITPYLKSLHWLRIKDKITYKIAVLMFNCINGFAPKYLQDLVIRNHSRTLRSSMQSKLPVIKCNLAKFIGLVLHQWVLESGTACCISLQPLTASMTLRANSKHIYLASPTILSSN